MGRLGVILALTTGYFSTIILEMLLANSVASTATIFEHMQSSLILKVILQGLFFVGLFLGVLIRIHEHGIFIVYITLLKFFELIPILIDLINLLFIYQYKINQDTSFNRLYLALILAFIRLLINLDVIRRKCDSQWKRRVLVIFDLLLFILVNTSLLRDSSKNPIRIVRKIILGALIFQLNNQFYNESFSMASTQSSEWIRILLHLMLFLRWILSSLIIGLFLFLTLQSPGNNEYGKDIFSLLLIVIVCMIIVYILLRDTLQNSNSLAQHGIIRFCTGIRIATPPAIAVKIPVKKKSRTCSVCYDDKECNHFEPLFTAACQHVHRTVCDDCLLIHVRHAVQITFTDDIHCPELQCGVRFDYETVKDILSLACDVNLLSRYDQYVTHQLLEQMDGFIWCANPQCHAGQINDGGIAENIVTCVACHQKTCFTHRMPWHEGRTCEEYDLEIDPNYESSRRWIVEYSKKCPACPFQIEKNDGCDHMTCTKCRHEFCWACLADFQPIRQDGNHRHRDTCKHYASYNDE